MKTFAFVLLMTCMTQDVFAAQLGSFQCDSSGPIEVSTFSIGRGEPIKINGIPAKRSNGFDYWNGVPVSIQPLPNGTWGVDIGDTSAICR